MTEEELAEAKTGYLQRQTVSRSSDSGLARLLAQNIHVGRTMDYYDQLESSIPKISADEVREAMRRHIDPKKLYTVVAGDFGAAADGNKSGK